MAILRLIDSVSIGISLTGARTEPSISLVNSLSIGCSLVGGHVVAENTLVNTTSVGHATPDEMKDMSYLIVNET
jgi:hypothetical protein